MCTACEAYQNEGVSYACPKHLDFEDRMVYEADAGIRDDREELDYSEPYTVEVL